jgi:hypothetical protein
LQATGADYSGGRVTRESPQGYVVADGARRDVLSKAAFQPGRITVAPDVG